jgi:hypothetical protein
MWKGCCQQHKVFFFCSYFITDWIQEQCFRERTSSWMIIHASCVAQMSWKLGIISSSHSLLHTYVGGIFVPPGHPRIKLIFRALRIVWKFLSRSLFSWSQSILTAIWTTRNDFIFKGIPPAYTDARKSLRMRYLSFCIRPRESLMVASEIALWDFDNFISSSFSFLGLGHVDSSLLLISSHRLCCNLYTLWKFNKYTQRETHWWPLKKRSVLSSL